MALKTTLNDLLKEYAPEKVANNEFNRLNYYWKNIKKNKEWIPGSNYRVDFEIGEDSTFTMGGLPAIADIHGAQYAKANIANPATLIGSIKIHEKDMEKHKDAKKSFLSFWPEKLRRFTKRMEERTSVLLLGDGSICAATANGTALGVLKLDRPHLLTIGEKVEIKDNDTAAIPAFVRTINLATKEVTFYDAATGGAVVDLSGITTAAAGRVYITGTSASAESFNTLASFLFPAAVAGGSDTIHGLNKVNGGPILQPLYVDGSSFTTGKKLTEGLYSFMYEYDYLGRSEEAEITVDYNQYMWMALFAQSSKYFKIENEVAGIGYKGFSLLGPNGTMKVKALRDLKKGMAATIDFSALEFAGQTMFKMKHKPNGDMFHTERIAGPNGGFVHIVDVELEGQHVCKAPYKLAGIHSIPTITAAE